MMVLRHTNPRYLPRFSGFRGKTLWIFVVGRSVAPYAPPGVGNTMSRRAIDIAVSITASAIIAIMVFLGAAIIARATEAACSTAASTACKPDPMVWCRLVNSQTVCTREKS
jgi:hypothetical protein